jgi:hypothetical protein
MWFDNTKNYIKLRENTGHPLKIKELYNKMLGFSLIYKFNIEIDGFEEFINDPNITLADLLDYDEILIFADPKSKTLWLWIGKSVNTRMKFIVAKMTPRIRDKHGIDYKIKIAEQGYEPIEFLKMLGLKKDSKNDEI